jgi:hypothetical protein
VGLGTNPCAFPRPAGVPVVGVSRLTTAFLVSSPS